MHALRAPVLDAPPLQRYGLPEYTVGDSPAAGAHFTHQIEGQYHERLVSLHVRLVTDANVANRQPLIEFRDSEDNRFLFSGAPTTQAASLTNDWVFSAFQYTAEWTIDDSVLIPLASVLLPPTFDFRVYVDNIQATDQLSRIRFVKERFWTAPVG
jgi:hypothetical protein